MSATGNDDSKQRGKPGGASGQGGAPSGGRHALTILLLVVLPAVGLFIAFYWSYVSHRRAALTQRSYRTLARVSRQLTARLEGIKDSMAHPRYMPDRPDDLPSRAANVEFITDFNVGTPQVVATASRPEGLDAYLNRQEGDPLLYLRYRYPGGNGPTGDATAGSALPNQVPCGAHESVKCAFKRDGTLCGRTKVSALVSPLLPDGEFADLLLIREASGEVAYQRNRETTGEIPTLRALREQVLDEATGGWFSASKAASRGDGGAPKGSASASPEGQGDHAGGPVSESAAEVNFSHPITIRYMGAEYLVLFERLEVPFPVAPGDTPSDQSVGGLRVQGGDGTWILCGLVDTSRFAHDAQALPSFVALTLAALVVMAALLWPALKLRYIDSRERLRTADVYVLVVASVAVAGVATFFVLHTYAQLGLRHRLDEQLQRFATQIQDRFAREVNDSYEQLVCFDALCLQSIAPETPRDPCGGDRLRADTYPYLKHLFWIDQNGWPYWAWRPDVPTAGAAMIHEPAPFLQVQDRPYFIDSQAGRLWHVSEAMPGVACRRTLPSSDVLSKALSRGFSIESVQSRVDGDNLAVIATPLWDGPKPQVALLAAGWASVIRPVTPPGFGFAVIDSSGRVLFHSNGARNLQENFLQEAENDPALTAAIAARRDVALTLNYDARPHRVYERPLPRTPWSLAVFYDLQLTDAMTAGIAETWLAMFLAYVGVFVAAGLLLQLWKPRYHAAWLWPDTTYAAAYRDITALILMTAAALLFSAYSSDAIDALRVVVALPPLLLCLAYARLQPMGRGRIGGCVVAGLLALWLLRVAGDWHGRAAILLAAGAWGGSFVADAPLRPPRYQQSYAAMLFALLLVGAVLPAAMFAQDAYGCALLNLVKLSQLKLAQDLRARAERLRLDYPTPEQDELRKQRLQDWRDIYALGWLGDTASAPHDGGTANAGRRAKPSDSAQDRLVEARPPTKTTVPSAAEEDPCRHGASSSKDATSEQLPLLERRFTALLMPLVPALNEPGQRLQGMGYDRASDDSWKWQLQADDGRLRFTLCDDGSTPALTVRDMTRDGRRLQVTTRVPSVWTLGRWSWTALDAVAGALRIAAPVVVGVVVLGVVVGFLLIRSLARRLFLLDDEPSLEEQEEVARPAPESAREWEIAWKNCSDAERLVLVQLQREKFANPNVIAIVRNLWKRGLVVRDPALRPADGFEKYIHPDVAKEEVSAWERHLEPSSWAKLQTPLLAVVVLVTAFLWITQPGLLDTTTGLVASVSTALPLLIRVFGMKGSGQSGTGGDGDEG